MANIEITRTSDSLQHGNPKKVPGAPGIPLLGNTIQLARDPLGFVSNLARNYGDVTVFTLAGQLVYLINNPEYIEEVLVRNQRKFTKSRAAEIVLTPFLGRGLILAEGEFWLRQRRLMQPSFHREQVSGYAQIITAYSQQLLKKEWRDGQLRDINKDMQTLALQVAARIIFGTELESKTKELGLYFDMGRKEIARRLLSPLRLPIEWPTPGNRRFQRSVDGINKFIYELIAERRRQSSQPGWTKPNDVLEILLSVKDETDGTGMSDLQIRDELMSLLFAGHDTSAAALSWLFYLIALHPQVEAKIVAEAEGLKEANSTALPRLPYTEMVVKEVLRLYPSGWVTTRQTVEDWKVGSYLIPAGRDVWLSPWVTQRDPRYFEQPQAFWPERWEGGKLEKALPRLAYSPFGGGPHQCIGQPLAMLEISLIAANLLKEYHLELVTEPPPLKPGPSLSLDPPRKLKLLLKKRR